MRVSTGKVMLKRSSSGALSFTVPKLVAAPLDKYVGIEYVCVVEGGSVIFQPLDKPRTFKLNVRSA